MQEGKDELESLFVWLKQKLLPALLRLDKKKPGPLTQAVKIIFIDYAIAILMCAEALFPAVFNFSRL